jgi:HK97 family phage prohead protease
MATFQAVNDNLYRGTLENGALARDDSAAETGSLLYGHFSPFDVWTEIDSWLEGRFMERFAVGAFKKTIKENRDQIRVQYDHGYDAFVGDAFLGPLETLREDEIGGYYEVPLLDTDYNRDRILPMLQGRLMDGRSTGSLLGASHRFRVVKDEWNHNPKPSDANPEGLPERTVREGRLYELGPVPWGAYPSATAGARSLSDRYTELQLARSGRAERAARQILQQVEPTAATSTDTDEQRSEPTPKHSRTNTSLELARAQLVLMKQGRGK